MRRLFYENDACYELYQDEVEYVAYFEGHQDEMEEEYFMEARYHNFFEGYSYNESTSNMEDYDENKEPTLHHDWITPINMKIALLKEEIEGQFLSTQNLQENEDTLM